ncbi:MAG: class I SAM-dependent methyltransferase [Gaiellaceae bacterium]
MRGWTGLYRTSVGLGLRHLARRGYLREAVIRVVVPLDPSRYLELPYALRELAARPGEHVLDLASPKLLAVALARRGVRVTTVDELEEEVERWRLLAGGEPNLRLEVADGRRLPYGDGAFDHAYSISVLEHIPDDGDAEALRELARVVRAGGRVVLTLPHAREAWDEYRDRPLYADHGAAPDGRYFFQRWYDSERVDALIATAPGLELERRSVARLQPNLNAAYNRLFPWLVPLGPLFGLAARERVGPDGDVVRLTLRRR